MTIVASYAVEEFEPLLLALQEALGIVVPEGQRDLLVQRVEPVMDALNLKTLDALAENLSKDNNGRLGLEVLKALSIYSSGWQINPETHRLLRQYVFNQLKDGSRFWIVGCGRGELAYSVAIELAEYEHQNSVSRKIDIIATDVLTSTVEHAAKSIYSSSELETLRAEYKNLYLATTTTADQYVVKDRIRDRIKFMTCDVVNHCPVEGKYDVVFCPEVLAYFSNGTKASVIERLASYMRPGAILIPDAYQMLPANSGFERVDIEEGVFYRRI